jgi:DNA-binding NarL/FixJ family response regulator
MKCLVVDDDAHACELMTHLLGRAGHTISIAPDGHQALELLKNQEFDIALVDMNMEQMSGAETMRAMRAERPDLRMLVVSGHDDRASVIDAVSAGADGYLLKTELSSRLGDAMAELMAGGGPLSARIAAIVLDEMRKAPDSSRPGTGQAGESKSLSKREADVLEGLSRGLTYTEIAAQLNISVNTVRHHIRNLYDKLGVNDKAQAVSRGLGLGSRDSSPGMMVPPVRKPRGSEPPPIK